MTSNKTKSISFNEEQLEDMIEMFEWALSEYREVNEEDYIKKNKVAIRVEKALHKLQGNEWDESNSHFETD